MQAAMAEKGKAGEPAHHPREEQHNRDKHDTAQTGFAGVPQI